MSPIEQYVYRIAPLAQGWYISVHIKGPRGGFPGSAHSDYKTAISSIRYWINRKCDIYLSMGGQKESGEREPGKPYPEANRTHGNIVCLRSLRMDVDAKQYASIAEMDAAIDHFYEQSGIPKATFAVKSGSGGYHIYWPFDRLVDPEEWQPLADALARAALSTGLKLDTECTIDRTRILRVPGTKNYKNKNNPTNVEIYYDDGGVFTTDELRSVLTQWLTASSYHTTNNDENNNEDNDEKNMQSGGKTYAPADIELVRKECGFIEYMLTTGGPDYKEVIWFLCMGLSCHTTDPNETAHKLTANNPHYNPYDVNQKLEEALRTRRTSNMGPPRCETIERNGSKQCANCKHRGQGKTPISFGYGVNGYAAHNILGLDLPHGYYRRSDKIWTNVTDPTSGQVQTICVFQHPIVSNSGRVETGAPYRFFFDTLEDKEPKTIIIPMGMPTDTNAAARVLGDQGCVTIYSKYTKEFFVAFIDKMKKQAETFIRIDPIGWHGDGFSFAGKYISPVKEGRCKEVNANLKYGVVGDDKAWRILADVIVTRNRLDLCCLVAAGFAAPLVAFTGHSGFLVGGVSSKTGIGKTTSLSLAQSIWGSPNVMNGLDDTLNHIIDKAATLKNLPLFHDEIKDQEQMNKFLKMASSLTQGHEKGRSGRDGTARQVREWQTEIIYAANRSAIAAAEEYSKGSAALMVRMLEYECGGPKSVDEFKVQRMVGALKDNYGSIGLQYADYLGKNKDTIDKFVIKQQDWFKEKISYAEGERFWFAAAATLTAGSYLAKMLGFAPFEPMRVRDYLVEVIQDLRSKRKDIATDYSNRLSLVNDLSHFLKEHQATGTLVTNMIITNRGQPKKGKIEVKNFHPMKRWDAIYVHIGLEPHMLRFSDTALGKWCRENQIPKENLIQAMMQQFGATKGTAILGSGVDLNLITKVMEKCWTIATEGTVLDDEIEWEGYK